MSEHAITQYVPRRRVLPLLLPRVARAVLVVVLAYAGGAKLFWPDHTASAWKRAGVVPENVASILATVLPPVEVGVAILIAIGRFPFAMSAIGSFMSVVFLGIHTFAYWSGELLPCTCLGASYLSLDQKDEHLFMMVVSLLMLISSLVLMRHESRRRVTSR